MFVTGHTGFKGTWLCKILIDAGAIVTGYALNCEVEPSLFELIALDKNMNSVIGDIRSLDNLKSTMIESNPEIVFHLAAQPLVRESYVNPVYTYEVNVMGTVNLLESIRSCAAVKSVVNVTTDKVYENREWEWGYREIENLCGFDPYSNSKSCSELVTYSYKKSFFEGKNIAISTVRAGNVIGGGDFAKDRIIPDCFRAAVENQPIRIRNAHSVRPYQHVIEPLMAYLKLAEIQYNNLDLASEYNIGPDDSNCVNTGTLTSLFVETWGNSIKWIDETDANAPHEASFLKLDNSKAKHKLGIFPKWDIGTAVEKTVEVYKCYLSNRDSVKMTMEKQIQEYMVI